MVSSSAASTAQRWAASVRLSFKAVLVVCEAKAQQRLACSRHCLGSPGMWPTPGHIPPALGIVISRRIAGWSWRISAIDSFRNMFALPTFPRSDSGTHLRENTGWPVAGQ
jgi:hypothetical protein